MKKLLVATSALAVTAPAFANEVTFSGSVVGKATTTDGSKVTNAVLSTLTLKASYASDDGLSGTIKFGHTGTANASTSLGIDGFSVSADTQLGKFTLGTSHTLYTDDDFIELNEINDARLGKNVDFPALTGFATGTTGSQLRVVQSYEYSVNDDTTIGITWGEIARAMSAKTSMGGFSLALDYSEEQKTGTTGKVVSPMVLNVSGDVGPVALKLEYGWNGTDNSGYDALFSYTVSPSVKVDLGLDSLDNNEIQVSGAMGGGTYSVFAGTWKAATVSGFGGVGYETTLAGMTAGLKYGSVPSAAGHTVATNAVELYLKPSNDMEIEMINSAVNGATATNTVNFKVSMSF